MQRLGILGIVIAVAVAGVGGTWALSQNSRANSEEPHVFNITEEYAKNSRSDQPRKGLAYDWVDCIEFFVPQADEGADRVACESWSAQGLTSSLFALRSEDGWTPVIETRLANGPEDQPVILDIVGGPGGEPFNINRALTDEIIERYRKQGREEFKSRDLDVTKWPEYELMKRGYTIASLGYWGMSIRTLEKRGEIDEAIEDVRAGIDHYVTREGALPPLVSNSLGNHLVLGALGPDRLQEAQFLSLVPVMDGLQHHVRRFSAELEEAKKKVENKEGPVGGWAHFNVYSETEDGHVFDHARMLNFSKYLKDFFGDRDLAWRDIVPRGACSRIILGKKDPRTLDYLAANTDLPDYVEVLDADHNLAKDAPERTRKAYAEFADCVKGGAQGAESAP